MKPVIDSSSRRLRPNVAASHPVIGRMMALATRYEVSAQVASSVVAAMLLAMCGSDTLTTVVSSTSMKVANITAIATIHGLTVFGEGSTRRSRGCLLDPHGRRHRHARPQQVLRILTLLEHDLHRHALHDLDEVAGGVLRRQQAEAGAGCGGDAVDVPLNDRPP